MKVNLKQMKVNVVKKTYYNIMVDIPEDLTMKEFIRLKNEVENDVEFGDEDEKWKECALAEFEILNIDYIEEAK